MQSRRTRLIEALRGTAARLRAGARYQWGHYGECNCGHLAQTLTSLSPGQIHRLALARDGEWRHQAAAFRGDAERCEVTGVRLDVVIRRMLAAGLSIEDIIHLETLSDPEVLARLPDGRRHLQQNGREDLILYLDTWADMLEARVGDGRPAARAVDVA
ncbi:MAG: hypothetical protein H6713_12355 [Myxococcales bacterium]|nr:hypothetical protein [Myxococcales bacterium]MCB9750769.1 hypothetical protein [Myxococcales bacterium]